MQVPASADRRRSASMDARPLRPRNLRRISDVRLSPVYVGMAPEDHWHPWLTYSTRARRKRPYVVVVWNDGLSLYDGDSMDGGDSMEDASEYHSHLAREPGQSTDDLINGWKILHPRHKLVLMGRSMHTPDEVNIFLARNQPAPTYRPLFFVSGDLSRLNKFINKVLFFLVTNDASWQLPVPVNEPDSNTFVPMSERFDSPLDYVYWQLRQAKLARSSQKNPKPIVVDIGEDIRRRPYSATLRRDGRVDLDIETHPGDNSDDSDDDSSRHSSVKGTPPPTPPMARADSVASLTNEIVPRLNVVILIVGSRGDVQPFVALGKELRAFGHNVRLATHATFKQFVLEAGLGFYPLAGDPAELMAYMVRNPGLLPGLASILAGDIGKHRRMMAQILDSIWDACTEPDPDTKQLFPVDAIISNPVTFGHIHVAQKLHVPLHMFFTMPWSPTRAFPHPLTNVTSGRLSRAKANFLSYQFNDFLTWQGLGDLINDFRVKKLHLAYLSSLVAPGLLRDLKVPFTYCWTPSLIPKPADWGSHIDIAGFFFLDLATSYKPSDELAKFLAAGPPPIYIGFGSIVVDSPDKLTAMIFEAVKKAGVRAVLSKGWGGIGGGVIPNNILLIDNVPHDWLFQHCSAVCHHGGAGTTAAGLRAGKPTIVVPFFGDQPFWGSMVASQRAGPPPLPFKRLTADRLAQCFEFAISDEAQMRAKEIGLRMCNENGVAAGVASFHKHLPLDAMRCQIDPEAVATKYDQKRHLRLSARVVEELVAAEKISRTDLVSYRPHPWNFKEIRSDDRDRASHDDIGNSTDLFEGQIHVADTLPPVKDERRGRSSHRISLPSPLGVPRAGKRNSISLHGVRDAVKQACNKSPKMSAPTSPLLEHHMHNSSTASSDPTNNMSTQGLAKSNGMNRRTTSQNLTPLSPHPPVDPPVHQRKSSDSWFHMPSLRKRTSSEPVTTKTVTITRVLAGKVPEPIASPAVTARETDARLIMPTKAPLPPVTIQVDDTHVNDSDGRGSVRASAPELSRTTFEKSSRPTGMSRLEEEDSSADFAMDVETSANRIISVSDPQLSSSFTQVPVVLPQKDDSASITVSSTESVSPRSPGVSTWVNTPQTADWGKSVAPPPLPGTPDWAHPARPASPGTPDWARHPPHTSPSTPDWAKDTMPLWARHHPHNSHHSSFATTPGSKPSTGFQMFHPPEVKGSMAFSTLPLPVSDGLSSQRNTGSSLRLEIVRRFDELCGD